MARESGSDGRCAHQTSRGYGFLNQARGGPFCPGHDPRNQCGRQTLAGTLCKRRATAIFDIIDTPLIVDAGIFAVAVALLWNTARARSDRS